MFIVVLIYTVLPCYHVHESMLLTNSDFKFAKAYRFFMTYSFFFLWLVFFVFVSSFLRLIFFSVQSVLLKLPTHYLNVYALQ